jgi:hypothetical protein
LLRRWRFFDESPHYFVETAFIDAVLEFKTVLLLFFLHLFQKVHTRST